MGWLFMSTLKGHATPKAYLDAQFTYEQPAGASKVLRSALVNLRTYYAAVEQTSRRGERVVFALVCLVRYNRRDREGYIFGYKDMDEGMGPFEPPAPPRSSICSRPPATPMPSTGGRDAARIWRRSGRCPPSRPPSPGRWWSSPSPYRSPTVEASRA